MFKKIFLILTLLCTNFTVFASQFDTMVVFGDSLSDNGNLKSLLPIPKSPPYFYGHFSNGPIWAEYLFVKYFPAWNPYQYPNNPPANFQNYAYGGAGATLSWKENLPLTLYNEILKYDLKDHPNKNTSLYMIWMGANNYLNAPTNTNEITTNVVDAIGSNIQTLIGEGAKQFLIINLPDMGQAPEIIKEHNQAIATQLILLHNAKLANKYYQLVNQYPDVTFAYLDVYSLYAQLVQDPTQFGLKDSKTSCYDGGYWLRMKQKPITDDTLKQYLIADAQAKGYSVSEQMQNAVMQNPSLKEALRVSYDASHNSQTKNYITADCPGLVFWDQVHPTTKVHQIIASYAKRALDQAGIVPVSK